MGTMRYHNALPDSSKELRELIEAGHVPVIQFDRDPSSETLEQVDEFCLEFGANLNVRFHGFGWRQFDTSILRRIPNVSNLSIDTIRCISDFAPISRLDKLSRLHFGVFEHPDGLFLRELQLDRFTHLALIANKRRNFDLSPLDGGTSLKQLFVQGHDRGIESISRLPQLEDVSLSGFPKRHDLAFLNDLRALRSLFLILGSRTSIAEFIDPELRKLRIVWVRLLEDLGPLQRFGKLENLEIEDQLRLNTLDVSGLRLRRLKIANCKQLTRIVGLESLAELRDLEVYGTKIPVKGQRPR